MGNNFDIRVAKAKTLINEVKIFLDKNSIPYFETGYEFLLSKNEAIIKIKKLDDNTSEFIRYYPDLCLILNNGSILLEVKNSTGIEKNCYLTDMKLRDSLDIEIIICNKFLKICPIEKIKFSKMQTWDYVAQMYVPVSDGVWKEPRLMEPIKYYEYLEKYKEQNKYTSGCSFAFIDFTNTEFKPIDELLKYSYNA